MAASSSAATSTSSQAASESSDAAPADTRVRRSHRLVHSDGVETGPRRDDPTGSARSAAPTLTAATPAASTFTIPTRGEPTLGVTSTREDAVSSSFADSAPPTPADVPALWTLLASARREFGRAFVDPSSSVGPLAGLVTSALVTNTARLNGQSITRWD